MFYLRSQLIVIQVLANQHQLIFRGTFPFIIVEGEALAAEVENVPFRAFLKPQDALSTEHVIRELIVQEVLKFFDVEGAIALDRQ